MIVGIATSPSGPSSAGSPSSATEAACRARAASTRAGARSSSTSSPPRISGCCRARIEVRFHSGFEAPEVSSATSSRSNSATSSSPGSTSSANAVSPTSMRNAALPAPRVSFAAERLPTGCIRPSAPSRSTSL